MLEEKALRPEEKARLSGAPGRAHNGELKCVITGEDAVSCVKCHCLIGRVIGGRNLKTGRVVIVNRAAIRCGMCHERQIWTPLKAA